MKRNGFTLVELLAVMLLLSIIALIVYPAVEDYVSGSKEKSYNIQINNIKAAANNWAADNTTSLPDDGGTYTLTLGTLIDGNYIEEVENPKTKSNFSRGVQIIIKNYEGIFTYQVNA